jgi:hypothetical protein
VRARAADIAPTIAELQAAGATSLRAIAAKLNEAGIETASGGSTWSANRARSRAAVVNAAESAAAATPDSAMRNRDHDRGRRNGTRPRRGPLMVRVRLCIKRSLAP